MGAEAVLHPRLKLCPHIVDELRFNLCVLAVANEDRQFASLKMIIHEPKLGCGYRCSSTLSGTDGAILNRMSQRKEALSSGVPASPVELFRRTRPRKIKGAPTGSAFCIFRR